MNPTAFSGMAATRLYAAKTARLCAQLLKITVRNPARLSHVFGQALWACEEVADRAHDLLRLPQIGVEDLLPANGQPPLPMQLLLFPKTNASISALEFACLILLMKRTPARNIFEFGTYQGVSITQLALNLSADSRICTLDLPDEPTATRFAMADAKDAGIATEKSKGALVPADLRLRIQFLRQDSAVFDESPYAGQMDFVFVDGAHNFDYVRNDSAKGWRMLRPGGIIAWHDCRAQNPDVVRYLLQCPGPPTRVSGTTLAFAVKP